jgi:hypothetical protein
MSIFEEAQYKMQIKRLDRLRDAKKKAELDAIKNPFATYQGRDPVDGTDIVQIGANEPVSGFKLISNAPMAIGDRVALRKNNQGGLQRVDDRNRVTEQQTQSNDFILLVGRSMLIAFNANVVTGVDSAAIRSNFLTAASEVSASNIFSLVRPDTYKNGALTSFVGNPASSSFDIVYSLLDEERPPLDIPEGLNPTITVNTERNYDGNQWVDTCSLTVNDWDSFTVTSVTAFATIYTFTYDNDTSSIEFNILDGSIVSQQKIAEFKRLGQKYYSSQLFHNDTLIGSSGRPVDWTINATYDLSLSAVGISDGFSAPFDVLDLGSFYWTANPPL